MAKTLAREELYDFDGEWKEFEDERCLERERWIEEQHEKWFDIGSELMNHRLSLGVTATQVAEKMGISLSRLRNFEQGLPVKEAKLIENAYRLYLENVVKIRKSQLINDFIRLQNISDKLI
ncbi:helix-turn-helix domain-containing protein [Paenibacillus turpanensis]|uniref:helix-turn-helix domain-containing protein n=1 Tax=Paenibacillus turpanensis TaxID=2689078 RepID=UPI00140E1B92|nr:helix-turn-helix transcriptional regulator [Paenibacillus turpanensis]